MESMSPNQLPASEATKEEIAEMEKSRTISDAELLKNGAEHSINNKGEKENLLLSTEQIKHLHWESIGNQEFEEDAERFTQARNYIFDSLEDYICTFFKKFETELESLEYLQVLGRGKDESKYQEFGEILPGEVVSNELKEAWKNFVFELGEKATIVIKNSPNDKKLFITKALKDHNPACVACLGFYLKEKGIPWSKYISC